MIYNNDKVPAFNDRQSTTCWQVDSTTWFAFFHSIILSAEIG